MVINSFIPQPAGGVACAGGDVVANELRRNTAHALRTQEDVACPAQPRKSRCSQQG